MRGSEEAIEKVLAGLRDAEAPAGMERRILGALEEREVVRVRLGWRSFVPEWLGASESQGLVWGVGLAGLLMVVLVIPVVRRSVRVPAYAKGNLAPAAGMVNRAVSEGVAKSAHFFSGQSGVRAMKGAEVQEVGTTGVQDSDALAVEEMHAESRPAPPLPLTEQERLMLRLVHSGDRQELAKLNPMVRMDQEAEETAEFQRFFEPVDSVAEPDEKQSDTKVEKEGEGR